MRQLEFFSFDSFDDSTNKVEDKGGILKKLAPLFTCQAITVQPYMSAMTLKNIIEW